MKYILLAELRKKKKCFEKGRSKNTYNCEIDLIPKIKIL